jgi:hypothetical protein
MTGEPLSNSARSQAIALGELCGAAKRMTFVRPDRDEDFNRMVRLQVDTLHQQEVITSTDRDRLHACLALFTDPAADSFNVYGSVLALFREAVDDPASSPVALAILSVTRNSTEAEAAEAATPVAAAPTTGHVEAYTHGLGNGIALASGGTLVAAALEWALSPC